MARQKKGGINPKLEKAIEKWLDDFDREDISQTDKKRIIDAALKLEAIKAKLDTTDWGSAFKDDDDEETE